MTNKYDIHCCFTNFKLNFFFYPLQTLGLMQQHSESHLIIKWRRVADCLLLAHVMPPQHYIIADVVPYTNTLHTKYHSRVFRVSIRISGPIVFLTIMTLIIAGERITQLYRVNIIRYTTRQGSVHKIRARENNISV